MEEILRILPNTFIPLFVATNIFMLLPIFISLTKEMTRSKEAKCHNGFATDSHDRQLSFIALGEVIFRILGITADDFKIAGGTFLL